MKKIITNTLGLACLVLLVLAGGEMQDGSCNILWTLGCLAGAALCGWAFTRLEKEARNV